MCDRCGAADHAVMLTERPAHVLVGRRWRGTHAEAAAGAVSDLIADAAGHSAGRSGLWRSPVAVLNWSDGDLLTVFAGVVGKPSPDLETVELPEMTFASAWHDPSDGSVVEHYGRMIAWLRDQGIARRRDGFQHREEYAPDGLSDGDGMRLLLPVDAPRRSGFLAS